MAARHPVTAVLVNWRTRDLLAEAVAGLGPVEDIIIVDPSSPDGVPPFETDPLVLSEAAKRPSRRVLRLPENRGFGAAANAGARAARSPFVLFANPDARPGPGAVAALLAAAESLGAAAVAPRLVDRSGRHQTGDAGAAPSVAAVLAQASGVDRLLGRAGLFVTSPGRKPRRVGWLSGAFLLVRRDAFLEVGGFDESFFLYGEDVDLGERLRRKGHASWHVPSVAVVHEGGASFRRDGDLSPLEGLWALGLRRAHARREPPPGPLARGAFAAILAAGLFVRSVAVPNPRVDRRRFLAAARWALAATRAREPASPSGPARAAS